jgi:hypothetical protein
MRLHNTLVAFTASCALALCAVALPQSAHAATRIDIVALANANLGKHYCDTNSLGGKGFGPSCAGHNWCSDFAKWVWQSSGIDVGGLSPESGSFYTYGQSRGTLHADAGYVPQLGDAVVFNYHGGGDADHISLVGQVNADGTIVTINGNYGGTPTTSSVKQAVGGGRVGQYVGGQRISAFVSPVGVSQLPTARLGVLQGGAMSVKEGNLYASWVAEWGAAATKFEIDGDMIGVLSNDGVLHVKQGNLYAGWVDQLTNVKDFALEASTGRIGVLRTNGTLTVKGGGLYGAWVEQIANVTRFDLSGDYVGVVLTGGMVAVKQGNLYSAWVNQIGSAADLELDAGTGRIGVLRTNGTLAVKDGGLFGSWTEQIGNAREFHLTHY